MAWTREQMCERASKELEDGFYVNLGIGMPTLVANYISEKNNSPDKIKESIKKTSIDTNIIQFACQDKISGWLHLH